MKKEAITNVMKRLGVTTNLSGYYYIRESVELMLEDFTYTHAITKRLYPDIAKKFDTTPSRVERAIRHAIERTWGNVDLDFVKKVFGYKRSYKYQPTNTEFITAIADYITINGEKEV